MLIRIVTELGWGLAIFLGALALAAILGTIVVALAGVMGCLPLVEVTYYYESIYHMEAPI